MTALDLASDITHRGTVDKELEVWAARLAVDVAEKTVYLGRLVGKLPEDLQAQYWEALHQALENIPSYAKIAVSAALFNALENSAPSEAVRARIRAKVYIPTE